MIIWWRYFSGFIRGCERVDHLMTSCASCEVTVGSSLILTLLYAMLISNCKLWNSEILSEVESLSLWCFNTAAQTTSVSLFLYLIMGYQSYFDCAQLTANALLHVWTDCFSWTGIVSITFLWYPETWIKFLVCIS